MNGYARPFTEEEYQQAKAQAPEKLPDICKVADLPLEGPPVIIDGLWRQQEVLLLGGHAKSWKSWAQMDLSYCIANGYPWLIWGDVVQGRVLHIDLELLDSEVRKRFELIEHARGEGSLDCIDVLSLRGRNFSLSDFSRLSEVIKPDYYTAVSFDPTYRMIAGSRCSESDSGVIVELMNRALGLARKINSGISLLQHFSKGNQADKRAPLEAFSGSGVWGRAPDGCVTFLELEDPKCYSVSADLRHWPGVEKFAVEFVHPRFVVEPSKDPENLKRSRPGRPTAFSAEDLCKLIESDEYISYASLRRRSEGAGVKKVTFDRRLKEAKLSGLLALQPVEATYFLTPFYLKKHRNAQH